MPPLANVSAPIVVGRESELAAVDAFLAARGGTLLLSGEAGIGKSRLVREAATRATRLGFRVLQGACFEGDQSLPYAPFLDLFRAFRETDEFRSIAATAPRLSWLLTGATPDVESRDDPEQEQRRLWQEVTALLTGLADELPLLAVIEDLHWSDETSLELLLRLVRQTTRSPLALLVTYRSDERSLALDRFLAEIDRQRIAAEIALHPLTAAEVALQLRLLLALSHPPGVLFVRSLHSLTGGNPFFVEEIIRSLVVDGDVYPSDDGWQRKPLDQLRVPRSVDEAVARRAGLLGPAASEILTLAAVAGRRVDFDLLQALSGRDEETLLAAIKELIAAQLIVEVSADLFAFRHALIRQAVYAGLLARERRSLHARVAEALERDTAGRGEAALGDLAYHHVEAGHWPRAYELARAAGDRARDLFAPQAAAEHYTRAVAAWSHLDVRADSALLSARGQAFDAIGDFAAARADHEAALAAAEAAGDSTSALDALLALGLLWSARDYEQALAWLRRGIDLARTMDDAAALAHALNRLGNWHANQEQVDAAFACHDEALAIFERLGDRRGEAETLDLIAMARSLGGDLHGAQDAAHRAATLFRQLGDQKGLAGVLPLTSAPNAVFELATMAGGASIPQAVASAEQALALAREIDWRTGESFLLAMLGEVWAAAGDFGRSLALVHESVAIAEEIDHRQWIVQARWGLARLFGTMLAPDRERAELERVLTLSREINSRAWINSTTGALASTLLALRDVDPAEVLLSDYAADLPMLTQGQRLIWVARAELALVRSQPREALAIVDKLYETAASLTTEADIPPLAQIKSQALVALGELDQAESLLRAAQRTVREQGAAPMLRTLHLALARVRREDGRGDQAAAEENAAREIAIRLAETIPAGELNAAFQRAAGLIPGDHVGLRSPAEEAPGGLTRREREVATYVAGGHSNREIADALFVSERTVEAHVANILRKLGVPSRAGIAAWAEREGLTHVTT